jgi:predicted DNA-binding transcriptional regulator AlpA
MTPGDLDTGERLLTAEEAATLRGVTTATWHRSVQRGSYPQPDGHVGRTPVWKETTVKQG